MTTKTPATSPTEIYLAGLSEGSQQGMRQSLEIIASILTDDHDAKSFPWQQVTYADSMAVPDVKPFCASTTITLVHAGGCGRKVGVRPDAASA